MIAFIFQINVVSSAEDSWPMFRGNQKQTGIASGALPDQLELLWKFETEGPILSSAVIADGKVFFGADDFNVYALNFESGEKVWEYKTEAPVEAPPMYLDGTIYIGSTDNYLYSLNARDGSLNWKFETFDKIVGSANWAHFEGEPNPLIVIGSYDGALYGLDSKSGEKKWEYVSQNYINGSPAVLEDKTVVGGCDALVHSVSIKNGTALSTFEVDAYIAASVAYNDGKIYVGHYGNEFVCIDMDEQELVWNYKDRNFPFMSSPAVTDSYVVFGGRDRQIHCVEPETGDEIWKFRTRGKVDSSPVICDDEIVVGSEDGRLYRLQLSDGKEIQTIEIGAKILASPAVAQGRVVIGAEDGVIYAFGKK